MKFQHVGCTELESSETVILFPSFGHWDEQDNAWRITISGVILDPGLIKLGKRIMLRLFRLVLGKAAETEKSDIFQCRIRDFAAATEGGKRVVVRVGSEDYLLKKKTKSNGHFAGTVRITSEELRQLEKDGHFCDGWLRFNVVTPSDDERPFAGRVLMASGKGVSVISDIDDTIKHTNVSNRDTLLANTFLREFQVIDGMAAVYRSWAESGAVFHYVSSSPWQLYRALSKLCDDHGFPAGTFHLRIFRLGDHFLRKVFRFRRQAKFAVMKTLLKAYPERQFVLVGDSGERDPEIYGKLARKYPEQILAIFIRQIPGERLDISRCTKAFRKVPADAWHVFESPEQLSGLLGRKDEKSPLAMRP